MLRSTTVSAAGWALFILLALPGAARGNAPRAFVDRLPDVSILENHHEALAVWARHGVSHATVVHVDSHHDMLTRQQPSDWQPLRKLMAQRDYETLKLLGDDLQAGRLYALSDYLVPAWDLGLVSEIWWVYPHAGPFDAKLLEQFRTYLAQRQLGMFAAEEIAGWRQEGPYLRGTLRGIAVTVSRIEDLPHFQQPVLLDIDCDYFVGDAGLPAAFDLGALQMKDRVLNFISALRLKQLHVEVATIALSVNGDFLPLRYRYLGRLLAELLADEGYLERLDASPWREFWAAESAFDQRNAVTARAGFTHVAGQQHWLADQAVYNLALLSALSGDLPAAVHSVRQLAVRREPFAWGVFDIAEIAKRQRQFTVCEELNLWALGLQGRWEFEAHLNLGRLYAEFRRWGEAERQFRAACRMHPQLDLPRVLLADSLMGLYRFEEALGLYRETWDKRDADIVYRDENYLPNLVKAALLSGDRDLARQAFERLQQVDRGSPQVEGLRGMFEQVDTQGRPRMKP